LPALEQPYSSLSSARAPLVFPPGAAGSHRSAHYDGPLTSVRSSRYIFRACGLFKIGIRLGCEFPDRALFVCRPLLFIPTARSEAPKRATLVWFSELVARNVPSCLVQIRPWSLKIKESLERHHRCLVTYNPVTKPTCCCFDLFTDTLGESSFSGAIGTAHLDVTLFALCASSLLLLFDPSWFSPAPFSVVLTAVAPWTDRFSTPSPYSIGFLARHGVFVLGGLTEASEPPAS